MSTDFAGCGTLVLPTGWIEAQPESTTVNAIQAKVSPIGLSPSRITFFLSECLGTNVPDRRARGPGVSKGTPSDYRLLLTTDLISFAWYVLIVLKHDGCSSLLLELDVDLKFVAPLALLVLSTTPVLAADPAVDAINSADVDLIFEIGVGGRYQPAYEGSDDYELSAFPIFGVGYLNLPGLLEIGSTSPQGGGFSFGPSFNYTSKRDFDDDPNLVGLNEVDQTFELGGRASYAWNVAEIWGEARYAFGGAEGFVGEIGTNAIFKPTDQLEFKLGPFATATSSDYMDDYFGVSASESANTGFRVDTYQPSGGFKSVGVRALARYEFRPDWFLNGDASYTKLVGDAADSPIVQFGDDDQFSVGLGISKRFAVDLF